MRAARWARRTANRTARHSAATSAVALNSAGDASSDPSSLAAGHAPSTDNQRWVFLTNGGGCGPAAATSGAPPPPVTGITALVFAPPTTAAAADPPPVAAAADPPPIAHIRVVRSLAAGGEAVSAAATASVPFASPARVVPPTINGCAAGHAPNTGAPRPPPTGGASVSAPGMGAPAPEPAYLDAPVAPVAIGGAVGPPVATGATPSCAAGAAAAAAWAPMLDSKAPTTRSKSRLLFRLFKHAIIFRSKGWYTAVQLRGSAINLTWSHCSSSCDAQLSEMSTTSWSVRARTAKRKTVSNQDLKILLSIHALFWEKHGSGHGARGLLKH